MMKAAGRKTVERILLSDQVLDTIIKYGTTQGNELSLARREKSPSRVPVGQQLQVTDGSDMVVKYLSGIKNTLCRTIVAVFSIQEI